MKFKNRKNFLYIYLLLLPTIFVACSSDDYNGVKDSEDRVIFEYDIKGNILQAAYTENAVPSGRQSVYNLNATYDDKNTVFTNISIPAWFFAQKGFDFVKAGANNELSIKEQDSDGEYNQIYIYEYDYNEDEFPITRYMSVSGAPMVKNREYTYKEYTFDISE